MLIVGSIVYIFAKSCQQTISLPTGQKKVISEEAVTHV